MLKWLIYGIFISSIVWFNKSQACEQQTLRYLPLNDEDYLIVNVKINGKTVIEGIDAYQLDKHLLIPISVLKNQLDMPIELLGNHQAIIHQTDNESCTYPLAPAENIPLLATDDSNSEVLRYWSYDDFDTYIDAELLTHLLQATLTFDYSLLQLNITSSHYKAIQAVDKKETALQQTSSSHQKLPEITPDKIIEDNYQWINYPVVYYRLNDVYQSQQQQHRYNGQLNSFFDFLGHQAQFRINKSQQLQRQYLKLSKQFQDEQQPLSYQLGDIQSQSDPLIHNSQLGRGFSIANDDFRYQPTFGNITIEEPVLNGWRAELYRNGQYLAETEADEDNRVVFNDVTTFYGYNLFEIKLFGPDGQQETKTQTYQIGEQLLEQHKWRYNVEFVDYRQNLLNNPSDNLTSQVSGRANVNYGLSNHLTANLTVDYLKNDRDNLYVSTGVNGLFNNGRYNVQLANQLNGGYALSFGYIGNLFNQYTINFNANQLHQFTSEQYVENRDIKQQINLNVTGNETWLSGVTWQSRYRFEKTASGESTHQISLNFAKNLLQGTFSNSFFYDTNLGVNQLSHRLYWSATLNQWHISTNVDWYPFQQQGRSLRQIQSVVRWPQTQHSYQQSQLSYNATLDQIALSHQYTYRHPLVNINVGAKIDDQGHWQVNAGLSGTIAYDYLTSELKWLPPQSLNNGQIETFVFVDDNRNDIFDLGEQPMADVEFSGNYQWQQYKTNTQGKVLLPASFGGQWLKVKEQSLSDPFLQTKYANVLVHSHKGGVSRVQIPLLTVNDIEGTIYRMINHQSRPASRQTVNLVNLAGDIIASTQSEYDGYFLFTQVPPGQYSLKISSDEINKHELIAINLPQKITAKSPGDAIILSDILLVDATDKTQFQDNDSLSTAITNQDSDLKTASILDNNNPQQYVIQLGVYKNFMSIYTAVQALPENILDIAIYYHAKRQRYYLVTGPYSSYQQASPVLKQLANISQYQAAFVQMQQKYTEHGWQLTYQLAHLVKALEKGKQAILTAPQDSYFCQLASYRAINSIDPVKLAQHQILVVKRTHQRRALYTLLTGPYTDKYQQQCQQLASAHLTPEIPELRYTVKLRQELARLDNLLK
jgi:hypothetical protein